MTFDTVNLPRDDFQVALRPIAACQQPRHQSDLAAVKNAVPSRQREYIAGRVLARELLDRLGVDAQTIASGPKREPLWPTGIVGSISHNELLCAVVVAQNSVVTSVGIDIETTGRIDRQLWGHLFTDEETEHLLQLESAAQSRQATAFFSIKEAFYKYQFPDNARLGRIQRRHRSSRRRIVLSIVGTDQRCNSGTQCPCRRRACWHRSDHCLSR